MEYELKFDRAHLSSLAVSEAEMDEAERLVDDDLKASIQLAHDNIRTFHESERFVGHKVSTRPGVTCWQKSVAIDKVGLYIVEDTTHGRGELGDVEVGTDNNLRPLGSLGI